MILDEVSNQINELIVGQPKNKNTFCKHIEKLIREAERYRQYLLEQQRKAEESGLTRYDNSKENNEEWTWSLNVYNDFSKFTYFSADECWGKEDIPPVIQFYMAGKPKPNPIGYLESMLWGSVGQIYEGLELLDYQFVLLAIIYDAQNWQAGRERIYFNKLKKETLPDRLCETVWRHLSERLQSRYGFPKDVQQTIETALLAVKAELVKEKPAKSNVDLASTKISQPTKDATSSEKKHWYSTVWARVTGVFILISVIISVILGVIQIIESDTYKQFVASSKKSQPISDTNTQADSNTSKQPSKTPQDTSKTLLDSNFSPPESPNQ